MSAPVVPFLARLAWVLAADAVTRAEDAVLALVPQGGQGGSRRNAWVATASEAALAAARRETEEALGSAWAPARAAGSAPVPPSGWPPLDVPRRLGT